MLIERKTQGEEKKHLSTQYRYQVGDQNYEVWDASIFADEIFSKSYIV